jgi:hypothetical protein
LYARQLPGRSRLDARGYRALHRELLAACRDMAATGSTGNRAYYEDLCYLAEPWLTPWVLQQTDREVLLDLLERCERAHQQLSTSRFARVMRWLVGISVFLACASLTALLVVYLQGRWGSLLDKLDDNWRLLVLSANRLTSVEWLVITGGMMLAFAVAVVWRTGWRR